MSGRLSPTSDCGFRIKTHCRTGKDGKVKLGGREALAWMGETLRPQGGKGKFFGWEALARVRQDVMVHGVRRESLAKRGVRKVN